MKTDNQTLTSPDADELWNSYARLFATVTTSMQLAVYKEACLHLNGIVVDCGCGSAKIAPFLAAEKRVFSYTGIDSSEEMVSVAKQVLQALQHPHFTVQQGKIESLPIPAGRFTAGISIQSYYSWPEPEVVLQAIYRMLAPQAIFVLATPNRRLPIEQLAKEAEQELISHPDFAAYKAYNLKLATAPEACFVDMDKLVGQVQKVGFRIEEAHQRHFRGGLNFLVLTKEV